MDRQVYEQKINDQRFLIETLKAVNNKLQAENKRLKKKLKKSTCPHCGWGYDALKDTNG